MSDREILAQAKKNKRKAGRRDLEISMVILLAAIVIASIIARNLWWLWVATAVPIIIAGYEAAKGKLSLADVEALKKKAAKLRKKGQLLEAEVKDREASDLAGALSRTQSAH